MITKKKLKELIENRREELSRHSVVIYTDGELSKEEKQDIVSHLDSRKDELYKLCLKLNIKI